MARYQITFRLRQIPTLMLSCAALLLAGCTAQLDQMNQNMEESTVAIRENTQAIQSSSLSIQNNTKAIDSSSKVLKDSTEAIGANTLFLQEALGHFPPIVLTMFFLLLLIALILPSYLLYRTSERILKKMDKSV